MSYVLVVDDDEMLCELLDIVLSEDGYDVQCARTVGHGLELAQQRQPAVILPSLPIVGETRETA